VTSEGRVCLGLADVKRYRVPYFGAEMRKARASNERLCHVTESKMMMEVLCDGRVNV